MARRRRGGVLTGVATDLVWGLDGLASVDVSGTTVVVVDVLSFSTAVSVAVRRGARVWPHPWRDDSAAARAAQLGAVYAPRRGAPGSLSPGSLRQLSPGTAVLLPSPNGATCSLAAADAGAAVVAGCLRNAAAVARWVVRRGDTVTLVAAGERWPGGALRPSYEDLVGAGTIAAHLADAGWSLTPDAEAAALASSARRPLGEVASGRELIAAGFAADVTIAEAVDGDDAVPVLTGGADGWFYAAG